MKNIIGISLLSCLFISTAIQASNSHQPEMSVLTKELCADNECKKKYRQLKNFAKYGSTEAQIVVSIAYLTGNGLEKNPKLAVRNLKKAKKGGSSRAAWMLAYLYKNGIGTEQNTALADEYFQYALDKDFSPALFEKATELLDFSHKENHHAVTLLTRAAATSSKQAKYLLAKMYELGEGVEKDLTQAAKLYKELEFFDYKDSRQRLYALINNSKKSADVFAQLSQFAPSDEIITINGEVWGLQETLGKLVNILDSSGLYDGKSAASHIRGQGCANSSSSCSSFSEQSDKERFLGAFVR